MICLAESLDICTRLFSFELAIPFTYVKVSRRVTNCETNAKKLIPRAILTENSPKSPGMDLTHPILRFEIFETQPNLHYGQNCRNYDVDIDGDDGKVKEMSQKANI